MNSNLGPETTNSAFDVILPATEHWFRSNPHLGCEKSLGHHRRARALPLARMIHGGFMISRKALASGYDGLDNRGLAPFG